jgi:nucleoside 2-deoxyribosyltransferase
VDFSLTLSQVPGFLRDKGVRDTARAAALTKAYLSIYTRERSEGGSPPAVLDLLNPSNLERLAETYANSPATAKPDKLLRLLERRTAFPGALASFNPQLDCPAIHAVSAGEFLYYLDALAREGLIETPSPTKDSSGRYPESVSPDAAYGATITLAGWTKLGVTGVNSRTAFVAMSFDHSLDNAYSDGIEPPISETGYHPLRVDKVHHNEKICDRIVVEIRRSRFLVADVTGQRQGVYFEAGFATALGLPVIWCCRKDDLHNVHFDTRQYNHIVWEQPADLRQQLQDRILATIGTSR